MHVLIAGASGLLGTALADHLVGRGHTVERLTRSEPDGDGEHQWDPDRSDVPQDVVDRADVVVNLAGSSLLGNPHSSWWAERARRSRIDTTRTLAEAIARSPEPAAFLAGNGSSFYGDHGAEVVTEDSESRGEAFLTLLTRDWQAATEPATAAGARVCILRTAPVATRDNPLYRLQLPLFRAGLGPRLGNGEQYFPLISLRDWVGGVTHVLEHDEVSGPVNLCCPRTPTNAEYTRALAAAVDRKPRFAVPAPLLRLTAGRMAPETLGSINLRPAVLEGSGYEFQDRTVDDVLGSMMSGARA